MEDMNTTTLNVSHKEMMENINMDLQEAIEITALDFKEVNDTIKDYYNSLDSQARHVRHTVIEDYLQSMVINLQHHDIFRQRVEHVVLVHQKLTTDEWLVNFVEFVFHLHIFQAMTIELDLLKVISSVADTLNQVHKVSPESRSFRHLENCFPQTTRIKEIIKKTVSVLHAAGGNIKQLPVSPLTVNQLTQIYSLYTMASERVVLDWFIHSIPSGSWEELLLHYQEELNNLDTDTELF